MTTDLLVAPSPVFELDGEVRGELARDLVHLEVAHDTAGLKQLRASFVGTTPEGRPGETDHLSGELLDFGKPLVCSIGPQGHHYVVFRGTISAIDVHYTEVDLPVVTVHAEDALMKLRMVRRSRTYEDSSDADVAEAIASEHGLTAEADAPGPTYDVIQQFNQTDLAFLRERARRIDAELWADDRTLGFTARGRREATELTLVRGNQLIEARAAADLAHVRGGVQVSGYDAGSRSVVDERAGRDALSSETGAGIGAVAVLERALGERLTARVRDVPLASGEATDWAAASIKRRGRSFVTVHGVTSGSPDLVVGSRLELQRMGGPFEGSGYYTTAVRHTYDTVTGYRTHFTAERPTIGGGS